MNAAAKNKTSWLRTPPINDDAEAAVLGATILDPRVYARVAKHVSPADFWRESHRRIWRAISAAVADGHDLDALTIIDQLARTDELEAVGGHAYVAKLSHSMPSAANIQSYVDILVEKSRLRQIITGLECLVGDCYENRATSAEAVARAGDMVREVMRANGRRSSDPIDVAKRIFDYQQSVLAGETVAEYTCGIPIIDRLTRWRVGQYHVIGAYSGHGKTTVCGAIAGGLAYHHNAVVSWWNCEIRQEFQALRVLTSLFSNNESGLPAIRENWAMHPDRVPAGSRDRFQAQMVKAVSWFAQSGIHIEPPGAINIRDVELTVESLRMDHPDRPLVVVVDYLQHMTLESDRRMSQGERVAECSRRLSHVAKRNDCIVIAASQFTETDYAASAPIAMPKVAQTRDSKDVRNDADAFFAYHRPWSGADHHQGLAIFEIGKDRWGVNGHVLMDADGSSNTFSARYEGLPASVAGLNSPRLNGGRL